jgi:hypothetical protein
MNQEATVDTEADTFPTPARPRTPVRATVRPADPEADAARAAGAAAEEADRQARLERARAAQASIQARIEEERYAALAALSGEVVEAVLDAVVRAIRAGTGHLAPPTRASAEKWSALQTFTGRWAGWPPFDQRSLDGVRLGCYRRALGECLDGLDDVSAVELDPYAVAEHVALRLSLDRRNVVESLAPLWGWLIVRGDRFAIASRKRARLGA